MSSTSLPDDLAVACAARTELNKCVLEYLNVATSTNDYAVLLAKSGAVDGTTVGAGSQTSGRGRRGHAWHSPSDVGLYMSVILKGEPSPIIPLLAGVAVAESIQRQLGLPVELKWPNDVLVSNRCRSVDRSFLKVAGILAETLPVGAGEGVVLGLGVNIREHSFPPELTEVAISLETAVGQPVERGRLCAEILVQLLNWRACVETFGSGRVLNRWRNLSACSCGAMVSWEVRGTRRQGVTAGIDDSGALLVDCEGRRERVVGGELMWEL